MSNKSVVKSLSFSLVLVIINGSILYADSAVTAEDHLLRAKQATKAGNLTDAAKGFLAALSGFEQTGDKKGQATCHTNLGLVYLDLGEYKKSKDYSAKAIKLREGSGDRVSLGRNINNLALASIYLGEYNEAIHGFTRALEINREASNAAGCVVNLKNIGLAYFRLGQYSSALKSYNAALQMAESNRAEAWSPPERWALMNNIGAVYKKLGQIEKAMGIYLDLLNSGIQDEKNEAYLLNNIGTIYRNLGDPVKALDYYTRALKKLRPQEHREIQSVVLKNLGILYLLNLNQPNQAESYLLQSLSLAEKMEDKFEQSSCHTYLGELYFREGNYERSQASFRTALSMAKEISAMEIEWLANYGLGRISERNGDLQQAFGYYDRAIQSVESIRSRLQAERLKTSFLIDKVEAYEAVIRILYALAGNDPSSVFAKRAYRYAERSKARAFLDLITETGIRSRKRETNELETQKRQISNRMNKIQNQLYKGGPSNTAILLTELDGLEKSFETVELKISKNDPNYSLLRGPNISDTEAVQKYLLDEKSVVLQFFVGKRDIFSWLITKSDMRMVRYQSPEILLEKTRAFIKSVSRPSDQIFISLAQHLYSTLIQPIEHFIPERTSKIFVIPDGVLYYLPFEALVSPRGGGQSPSAGRDPAKAGSTTSEGGAEPPPADVQYFCERYDISYAPSTSVLRTLEEIPRKKRTADLLAFGDPIFSSEETSKDGDGGRGLNGPLVVEGMALQRLLYTGQEILKIQAYIPGAKEIYVKENATTRSFKDAVRKGFKVIHLATHSIIDEENIENSFIVLTEEKGSRAQGLLRVDDIFNTPLESDLVVLASCRSAVGKLTAGEGIDGFARGFLYAGTRAILVSLWEVNDQSTAFLMEQLYYHLETGATIAEAVRKAKLKFIRSSAYSHPFHWAPFVIIGDGKQIIFKKSSVPLLLYTTLGVLLFAIVLATMLRITRSSRTAA